MLYSMTVPLTLIYTRLRFSSPGLGVICCECLDPRGTESERMPLSFSDDWRGYHQMFSLEIFGYMIAQRHMICLQRFIQPGSPK